jgi:hypothetical protein
MPDREKVVVTRIRSLITDVRLLYDLLVMVLLGNAHDETDYVKNSSVCPCVRDMWAKLFETARGYYAQQI